MAWPEPQWVGTVAYGEALALQRARREGVIAGRAPEAFWLLQHPRVVTLGRRREQSRADEQALLARGVEVIATERGGLATWHGPGQLVGYLIADLPGQGIGVRATVNAMEQGLISWACGRGLPAEREEGRPGVWVGGAKLAAIGMHIRQGVSLHGFALNLCPTLSDLAFMSACGIDDAGVTSVLKLTGRVSSPASEAIGVGRSVMRSLVDASSPPR